jgi:heme exporter protein B
MTVARVRAITAREIALEAAGHEGIVVVLPFVFAAVLLAGLGFGPRPDVLAEVAPGLTWLIVLFAAVPLARGVSAAERDDGCWDLLRALSAPGELLAGKLAALAIWMTATWAVAAVLIAVLFDAPLTFGAAAGGVLGAVGLAAVTTVFGVLLARAERHAGLLPVLLCPICLPVLLAGTQAARAQGSTLPWLALLLAFDAVIVVVGWAVFPVLMEE